MATFSSHYSLWEKCAFHNEPFIIFEHDAIVVQELPENVNFMHVMTIGAPSYGKWLQPAYIGVGPLMSKQYFPGAHAYRVNRVGADLLMRGVSHAKPTDVYMNKHWFPWLEEYSPWPVLCKDSFTTIQNEAGCLAKHNWNEDYEII